MNHNIHSVRTSIKLPAGLYNVWLDYCHRNNIKLSKLVEEALIEHTKKNLVRYEKSMKEQADDLTNGLYTFSGVLEGLYRLADDKIKKTLENSFPKFYFGAMLPIGKE